MANDEMVFDRVMAGYERSRLQRAVVIAIPTLLIPTIAFLFGGRLLLSVGLGTALWCSVVVLAWRGQAWGLSVPTGLKAGLFPLGLSLTAQRIGHVCTAQGCTSLCVPMCSAGGLIAGLIISAAARRSPVPKLTLVGSAIVSVAVGALGCSCVGLSGMLGMMAGLALSVTLSSVVARTA